MDTFDYSLLPPKEFQIMNHTENNFKKIGNNHLKYFVEELGLKPTDSVLEIGAGNGRIAHSLTHYLEGGSYIGVDIMKPFMSWCQKAYQNYDNFTFKHINVYNKFYNRLAFKKARKYKFPFENKSFDFIYLTSVFTHMHSEDIDNYLSEISRMVKPGGVVFITYFLINEKTNSFMSQGKSKREFKKYTDNAYTDNPKNPESAIAYEQSFIESLYLEKSLEITDVSLGKWRFPEAYHSINHNQDRVVAIKA